MASSTGSPSAGSVSVGGAGFLQIRLDEEAVGHDVFVAGAETVEHLGALLVAAPEPQGPGLIGVAAAHEGHGVAIQGLQRLLAYGQGHVDAVGDRARGDELTRTQTAVW